MFLYKSNLGIIRGFVMKVIILNGSPRKNNNTAQMLKSAKKEQNQKGMK